MRTHVAIAMAVTGTAIVASTFFAKSADTATHVERLATLESALSRSDIQPQPQTLLKDFAASPLPEVLMRAMAEQAQAVGLQLNALTIQTASKSAAEVGNVQFTVTAAAEYRVFKKWLAELLARYPSLAVQQLTLRSSQRDAIRTEVQLTLISFTKD